MRPKILIILFALIIINIGYNCVSAEDWCKKAENSYDQGKLKDALTNLDKCIADKCGSGCDCLMATGESMLTKKKPKLAARCFEKAQVSCGSAAKKPQALYKLATAYSKSGDITKKNTICSQLNKEYPNFHDDDTLCWGGPDKECPDCKTSQIQLPMTKSILILLPIDYLSQDYAFVGGRTPASYDFNESFVYLTENLTAIEARNLTLLSNQTYLLINYTLMGRNASENCSINERPVQVTENLTVIEDRNLTLPHNQTYLLINYAFLGQNASENRSINESLVHVTENLTVIEDRNLTLSFNQTFLLNNTTLLQIVDFSLMRENVLANRTSRLRAR